MLTSTACHLLFGDPEMEKNIIDFLMRYRYLLAVFSILLTVLIAYGGKNLYLESDYKIYFEDDEPQLSKMFIPKLIILQLCSGLPRARCLQ